MGYDFEKIRQDFPILNRKINGKRLVYFDNTATSQRPIQVINKIKEFYEMYNANIHRGIHTLSQEASELYEEAHDEVANFIGAEGREEIIFVKNTSEALNLAAFTLGEMLVNEGDEIIISIMEHHSNMLPWAEIARRRRAKLKVIDITDEHTLNYEQLEQLITDKTKIIAIVHMSNMLGTINDVKKISKLAHEQGAVIVVDGAQSVPHMPVNVKDLDIDFLAFSGHKMLGPTGIGVLWGKKDFLEKMSPYMLGGGMIDEVFCDLNGTCKATWAELPWKHEVGTPNIAGGIGLAEAVRYLKRIGMRNVREHEKELTSYTLKRIQGELEEKITIYGPRNIEVRGGIITFNIHGMHPHEVALYLDEYGIAVRSGHHCTQPLHKRLNVQKGTVRASFYIYNTKEEVDYFIEALKQIIQ